MIEESTPHFISIKRSRKSIHPSKTIKISEYNTSAMNNQTDKSTSNTEIEESSISPMVINEQDNDQESPLIQTHGSLKRPRLSHNKRLQANARERERVHNLTAAFEALRQVIPIYDGHSKLSRLSILRIACSYVLVLGVLNQIDFSEGRNAYTLNESFHLLSCTILNELKRKKSTSTKRD